MKFHAQSTLALLLTLAFGSGVASTAAAAPIQVQIPSSKGQVRFEAKGNPGFLKIRGEGTGPEGVVKVEGGLAQGQLSFDLNTLSTKISLRDEHMKKKYLEVEQFPKAELTFKNLKVQINEAGQSEVKDMDFSASLTVHGVTHPIREGKLTYKLTDGKLQGTAQFMTDIPSHKIPVPEYMGITVASEVRVTVDFEGEILATKETKSP